MKLMLTEEECANLVRRVMQASSVRTTGEVIQSAAALGARKQRERDMRTVQECQLEPPGFSNADGQRDDWDIRAVRNQIAAAIEADEPES